jgi:hypothetical protein
MQNKSLRIKVKIIKKNTLVQHTMYYKKVHNILNTRKKAYAF